MLVGCIRTLYDKIHCFVLLSDDCLARLLYFVEQPLLIALIYASNSFSSGSDPVPISSGILLLYAHHILPHPQNTHFTNDHSVITARLVLPPRNELLKLSNDVFFILQQQHNSIIPTSARYDTTDNSRDIRA